MRSFFAVSPSWKEPKALTGVQLLSTPQGSPPMDTRPGDHSAHFRKLATKARAGAANMADYGARQTMMQTAHMWDQIAECKQERSSSRTQLGPAAEQVTALPAATRINLRSRRLWIAIRSLAKLLQPEQHR